MTLSELRRRLKTAWCLETRSTGCTGPFDDDQPSIGQCVPTALIVQDLFGGKIIKVWAICGDWVGAHYLNALPGGRRVDLTKSQFPSGTRYEGHHVFARWMMLDSPEAIEDRVREKYELLKSRLGLT